MEHAKRAANFISYGSHSLALNSMGYGVGYGRCVCSRGRGRDNFLTMDLSTKQSCELWQADPSKGSKRQADMSRRCDVCHSVKVSYVLQVTL
jgi:hypothetical protein